MTSPHPPSDGGTPASKADALAVLSDLGLDSTQPDAELDGFAEELAQQLGLPYAMVNIWMRGRQHFLGLHTPDENSGLPEVGRSMSLEHGYCPEVVDTRLGLVLPDVFAHPRFASNEVVDQIGIRTYAGAPLIHHTGIVIGTVCGVGVEPRPKSTGRPSLKKVKNVGAQVLDHLYHRAGQQPPQ